MLNRQNWIVLAAAVSGGLLSTPLPEAHAWGDPAHRIVCAIATREMSESSRREVARLIDLDDEFSTFSESCVWPDHLRTQARRKGGGVRDREHYINTARRTAGIRTETCTLADECLFTAIKLDGKVLSNLKASDTDRLASLKFLGHWVGDIHQPLHVSYADDRGGNSIDAKGECRSNLHAVWDTCLIKKRLKLGDAGRRAQKLAATITDTERKRWNAVSMAGWADESYQIATSPSVKYCVQGENGCGYSAHEMEFAPRMKHRIVAVGPDYIESNGAVAELRLKQAGVRLAKLLDDLLRVR